MRVFISWSGPRSQQVSSFLQNVLRQIFGEIQFYVSSDMNSGVRWSKDIFDAIELCEIGIAVFTPENKFESWVMFEAGSLAKRPRSLLIPVYVDCTFHTSGPIHEFQGIRLRTHASESEDNVLRGNVAGIIRIVETIARHLPSSSNRDSIRLRALTDPTWWENVNSQLCNVATGPLKGDHAEPAEETPVLAYPHYRSKVTFEAMTKAVKETERLIGLSSVGLLLYHDYEPFRAAIEHRVLNDPHISLEVVLKDPATQSFVDQYKQMMGDRGPHTSGYVATDYFNAEAFEEGHLDRQLYPLPQSCYEKNECLSFVDILKYMPVKSTLRQLLMLLQTHHHAPLGKKGKFSLQLYRGWFLHSVIVFDHELYVFPYGINHEATDAPLFRFLPHQIGFRYFREQFNKIKSVSEPPINVPGVVVS